MKKNHLIQTPKTLEFVKFKRTSDYVNHDVEVSIDNKKIIVLGMFSDTTINLKMPFDSLSIETQEDVRLVVIEYIKTIYHQDVDFDALANYKHEKMKVMRDIDMEAPDPEKLDWLLQKLGLSFPICVEKKSEVGIKTIHEVLKFVSPYELQGMKKVTKTSTRVNTSTQYFASHSEHYFCDELAQMLYRVDTYKVIEEVEFNKIYENNYEDTQIGFECLNWQHSHSQSESYLNQIQY